MSEIKSLYRWGSWKTSESEFAGIRVRQQRDLSITVDLEDYTNKFITEVPIIRERSRQRQESLTAQELSMLRGVLGTRSLRTQQVSPQFAAGVSLLLSAAAQPVVQDLPDANKLVRDMRRCAAQSFHFHSFSETPWHQLVSASWADASDRPRSDGFGTGGCVMTLATEKLCGHGEEDDVSVMAPGIFSAYLQGSCAQALGDCGKCQVPTVVQGDEVSCEAAQEPKRDSSPTLRSAGHSGGAGQQRQIASERTRSIG